MLKAIKKYYLATFLGFFAATLTKNLISESHIIFWKNLVIALAAGFAASLIAGTLFYFKDTKWGPKKREKFYNRKPFTDLFMSGFKQQGDALVGTINKYTVIINYTWPNGTSAIAINVLFDGAKANLSKEQIADIRKRHKFKLKGFLDQEYIINDGVIGWPLAYNFTPPTYEEIMSVATNLVEVLKVEGLMPVEYQSKEKPKLAAGEVTSFGFAG